MHLGSELCNNAEERPGSRIIVSRVQQPGAADNMGLHTSAISGDLGPPLVVQAHQALDVSRSLSHVHSSQRQESGGSKVISTMILAPTLWHLEGLCERLRGLSAADCARWVFDAAHGPLLRQPVCCWVSTMHLLPRSACAGARSV